MHDATFFPGSSPVIQRIGLTRPTNPSSGLPMLHRPRTVIRTTSWSGIFLALALIPALAADPTGDWKVAEGVANVRIAACDASLWGVISWEKTAGGRDTNNPNVSKQNR